MNSEIKITAVVVAYFPDADKLILNLSRIDGYVEKIFIWDNSPGGNKSKLEKKLVSFRSKIIITGTGKNEGIAFAINRCIEWAWRDGYSHLLTMDQDSTWDDFGVYIQGIRKNSNNRTIGIFSPAIYENGKSSFPEFSVVDDAITSGSVYCLDMTKKTGLLREDFFIDAVDLEYCYWARRNGFNTVRIGNAFLKQTYGNSAEHRLFGRVYRPANYTAFRVYHIVRNHIFLWKEYPELSRFEKKRIINVYILGRLRDIVFFEREKTNKFLALLKGIVHGLSGKGEIRRNLIS